MNRKGGQKKRAERPNSLDLSFPTARHANLMNGFAGACLRGIRQIRDRSENRMRFSERSSNLDVR